LPSLESQKKIIIQGTLDVNKKRGTPKTAWVDNITSRMGLKVEDEIRKVHGQQI